MGRPRRPTDEEADRIQSDADKHLANIKIIGGTIFLSSIDKCDGSARPIYDVKQLIKRAHWLTSVGSVTTLPKDRQLYNWAVEYLDNYANTSGDYKWTLPNSWVNWLMYIKPFELQQGRAERSRENGKKGGRPEGT